MPVRLVSKGLVSEFVLVILFCVLGLFYVYRRYVSVEIWRILMLDVGLLQVAVI